MRLVRVVLTTLLAAVVLALLGGLAALHAGLLPVRAYVVQTGSMSPTIPPRSEVVVLRRQHYEVGRVITVSVQGRTLTHRLVGYKADGSLITKGDANPTQDPWRVTPADVRGEVVAAPRLLGYWMVFLRQPTGVTTVVLSMTSLWLLWSLLSPASGRAARRPAGAAAVADAALT